MKYTQFQVYYCNLDYFYFILGGIDAITNENDAEGGGGAGTGFDVDQLLQSFTGKQQGGLTNLFDTLSGSLSK